MPERSSRPADGEQALGGAPTRVHEDARRGRRRDLDEGRGTVALRRRTRIAGAEERDPERGSGHGRLGRGKTQRGEQHDENRRPPHVHERSLGPRGVAIDSPSLTFPPMMRRTLEEIFGGRLRRRNGVG